MRLIACGTALTCAGLVALGTTQLLPAARAARAERDRQNEGCVSCHAAVADDYHKTAHFRTSAPVSGGAPGRVPAQMSTSLPTTRFRVERRPDGIYQAATWMAGDRVLSRSERMDLAVGSGRRGQSYLYWNDSRLYQLPLSYLVAAGRWVNSPGYVDGEVHFDRLIPPRCLECHATSFRMDPNAANLRYGADYELGLACRVCHRAAPTSQRTGVVAEHPASPVANPARLTRQQQVDLCALCHSGADRGPLRPPFSFVPGDRVEDHLGPAEGGDQAEPDAHGNQVALLARSRCFQLNPAMTCSTCHDVHETVRDVKTLSTRCLECHAPASGGGPGALRLPDSHAAFAAGTDTCVDCHMPLRPSRLIRIAEGDRVLAPSYRTHHIGVYRRAGRPGAAANRKERR